MAGWFADAKGFQLLLVRFKPSSARMFSSQLGLEVNNSADNSLKIMAVGYGAVPKLSLPMNGNVCIKPTCLGVTSSRVFPIQYVGQPVPQCELNRCTVDWLRG